MSETFEQPERDLSFWAEGGDPEVPAGEGEATLTRPDVDLSDLMVTDPDSSELSTDQLAGAESEPDSRADEVSGGGSASGGGW